MVLVSFVISILLYFLVSRVGSEYVYSVYMSQTRIDERNEENFSEFCKYVEENSLSVTDTREISDWVHDRSHIYFAAYDGEEILYEFGVYADEAVYSQNHEALDSDSGLHTGVVSEEIYILEPSDTRTVAFSDGIYTVTIIDFSEELFLRLIDAAALTVSVALFLFMVLSHMGRISARISKLAKEVKRIETQDINAPITTAGNDELSDLSSDIDGMRREIINRLEKEQEVWNANKDLITYMAHDIRNPLTALTGYLNLIKEKEYGDEGERDKFLDIAIGNAEQLRKLSDNLFEYFYVFGNPEKAADTEVYDADLLLEQLIAEHAVLLTDRGFVFERRLSAGGVKIIVDAVRLKRIFDNIFSNIEKYADISAPVKTEINVLDGTVAVKISNTVAPDANKSKSTGIGLLTCAKTASEMKCCFSWEKTSDVFEATVSMPIFCKEEKQ